MNRAMQAMTSVIGGILTFFIVKEFVAAMNTSGWGTLETTLIDTLLPAVIAIATIIMALKAFGVMADRD